MRKQVHNCQITCPQIFVFYFPSPLTFCVCLVAQSWPTLCDTMDCSPPASSVHGDSPGKKTGVGCHALLQEIFPTQVSRIAGRFFTVWATREAQGCWGGQPIPSPGDLPDSGIEPGSLALQADSSPAKQQWKPPSYLICMQILY